MGAPWFKLYAQQYLGDPKVRMLSDADRGILVDLWCIQVTLGGIPTDPVQLGRLLQRRPEYALKALSRLSQFFLQDPLKPSYVVSPRLSAEQKAYERKLLANQLNGTKGGRPCKNPLGFINLTHDGNPTAREVEGEVEGEKEVLPSEVALASPPPAPKRSRRAKATKPPREETNPTKIVEPLPEEWKKVFWRMKDGWVKYCGSIPRNLTMCANQWCKLYNEGEDLTLIRSSVGEYFAQIKDAKEKRPDTIPRDLLVFIQSYAWQGVTHAN